MESIQAAKYLEQIIPYYCIVCFYIYIFISLYIHTHTYMHTHMACETHIRTHNVYIRNMMYKLRLPCWDWMLINIFFVFFFV